MYKTVCCVCLGFETCNKENIKKKKDGMAVDAGFSVITKEDGLVWLVRYVNPSTHKVAGA